MLAHRRISRKRFDSMKQAVRILPAVGQRKLGLYLRMNTQTDLENSTAMFGRLAESNAMAQIMYGLALRSVFTTVQSPTINPESNSQ